MLKALMLKKKIDDAKKQLEELRAKESEFEKREADLATAIEEAETEEEKDTVAAEIDTLETEKTETESAKRELESVVEQLEGELSEEEEKQERSAAPAPVAERKEFKNMETRKFFNLSYQERDAFFGREDVKDFLERTRELIRERRSVNGSDLLIPTVVLDLIRENIEGYSKLYKHVKVRPVAGTARQNVMGVIPEAVWTEMCGKLNEIDISFTGVEVDAYKVGGFIPVCNALLEDSDISLATEIISAIGQGIGLALDKAILYGTGTKMPMGIVTRLTQKSDPSNPKSTIPWVDLSTSNVISISSKSDLALFKAIVEASGAAKSSYSNGSKFWAMSESTKTKLIANSLGVNAAGAIVAGQNGELPVIGGAIETLDFIPDGVIIGGYGDLYLLAERAGASMSQSEHVRFTDDETVFKGTARYDGLPVIANGFVAMDINGGTVSGSAVSFAPDTANSVLSGRDED